MATEVPGHQWRFFQAGGFDQVKLETGDDLLNLGQLDQKLWVALACPLTGLEFDAKTAAFIDSDHNGRIRAPELLAAVNWACGMLNDPGLLIAGGETLALASINNSTAEGAELLEGARRILAQLGKPEAESILLDEAADAGELFAATYFNGDGVIVPESSEDSRITAVIQDIASCMGTTKDRSGAPGIDQERSDAFFVECAAYDAWYRLAENDTAVLPLADKTEDAADAVKAIKAKVDDYFARCRWTAFDPRAASWVGREEEDYAEVAERVIDSDATALASFPLAQPAANKPLPLQGPVNPAYASALSALREDAIKPLMGDRLLLTEGDWSVLQAKLGGYGDWRSKQEGALVAKLGKDRIRELLDESVRAKIDELIAVDQSYERQAGAISDIEKLLRYIRDLHLLLINFVNFKNLYAGEAPAIFQVGVLYLDQRACHLCLTVENADRHSQMAGLAGAFLAYADCARKGGPEKMSIVAVFSQGDDQNLMVGRNGIFYDRKGRDYDATITKIIPNPISLREAFWSPYKKVVRLIEEQVTKRAAAADAAAPQAIAAAVQNPTAAAAAPADPATPAAGAAPVKSKFDPSVVALISVAVGSLAAAAAAFLTFIEKIPAWRLPFLVMGIMILISGPSMLLAFVKLRRRNLGPILDANGWAINSKARINVPFGTRLTEIAELPPGAKVDIHDHYAEASAIWPKVLIVVALLVWIFAALWDVGLLNEMTKHTKWGPIGKPAPWDAAEKEREREKEREKEQEKAKEQAAEKPAPPGATNNVHTNK